MLPGEETPRGVELRAFERQLSFQLGRQAHQGALLLLDRHHTVLVLKRGQFILGLAIGDLGLGHAPLDEAPRAMGGRQTHLGLHRAQLGEDALE